MFNQQIFNRKWIGYSDFILADYLVGCLDAYNEAVKSREKWYGREKKELSVGLSDVLPF